MADLKDMELVSEFARSKSEAVFAELVARHINLVYSVAMRFTRNPADAQDVTQAVFIILAQKANSLGAKTVLTGWLYETTRFTAMKLLRTKARQQAREQEAYMRSVLNDANAEDMWTRLEPLLEEAMARLSAPERTLLALRFYENKSSAEAAAALGIQEWATRKRAGRAVEKLRKFFAKRGIVLSAAVLTTAISANSVQAAPALLGTMTTPVAVTMGAAASTSTLTLIKGALKLMAWTKAKTSIVVGVSILLAAGTTTVVVKEIKARQFYIGNSSFPGGDSITINSVVRSGSKIDVRGHYNLVSQDIATLALYITTKTTNGVPVGPNETINIVRGAGDFELIDPYPVPGMPHLTMYTTNDHGFGGVYFGTEAEAKESRGHKLNYDAN